MNISKQNVFCNRWVCLTSLETSIRGCYNSNNYSLPDRIVFAKAIRKPDPSVDNTDIKN